MSFLKCSLVAATFVAAAAVVPIEARAQTTSSSSGGTSTDSITLAGGLTQPYRFIGSTNVTTSSRPVNLHPTGANFSDCEQNLMLQFPIVASGFTDEAHIEIWAGTSGVDCTQYDSRNGLTTSGSQLCWQVATSTGAINQTEITSFNIYVRDILRFESAQTTVVTNDRTTFNPNWAAGPDGESACHVQSADPAVSITVYFLAVISGGSSSGTGYQWVLNSDLVAPAAPTNVTLGVEDTALQVNWTSPGSSDPDLAGFIAWSDPPSGGIVGGGGCNCGSVGVGSASSYVGDGAAIGEAASGTEQVYRCPDGAYWPVPTGDDGGTTTAATDDASPGDGGEAGAADAGLPESGAGDDGPAEVGPSGDDGASDAGDGGTGEGGGDASDDSGANLEDGSDGSPYLGCYLVNVSIDSGTGNCYSPNLNAGFGVSGSTATSTDSDGSTSDDASSTTSVVATTVSSTEATASGLPGISQIPPQFNAGEIDSITTTQITLDGLTNGVNYVVVVTSIDGYGNVGPASVQTCAMPAPVTDFYKTYREANGSKPSGSCTLEGAGIPAQAPAFGLGLAGALVTFLRRRRRP